MTKYENEALGVSFELPDAISVRQQLRYRSGISFALHESEYERYWAGAILLMTAWECEYAPDPAAVDLDMVDDPEMVEKLVNLIQYVSNQTAIHMLQVRGLPKNS